ncbi:hypothetical protein [Glycomyces sp. MUSA5-2]|uniref:hypothetical protein n=1 Tax=Glycomyces sp. MUSA5-2 TaxID=2053002 RepID=UPI0030099614
MTDSHPATVHTSGCGNVAVEFDGASPVVRLSLDAVRLPVRDLADLVTATARDAADAVRAAQQDEDLPSSADALAELKNLRDGIRGEGLEAVLERKRAEYGAEDPSRSPDDPRSMTGLGLDMQAFPSAGLDMAIALLERFQPTQSAGPTPLEAEVGGLVATAVSEDEQVTVEATVQYPIARLLLGLHAREMGPELLAEQITATAARAGAELRERQRSGIDALGLPFTQDQIDGFPAQTRAFAKKLTGQAAYLQQDHDQTIKRLRQQ